MVFKGNMHLITVMVGFFYNVAIVVQFVKYQGEGDIEQKDERL